LVAALAGAALAAACLVGRRRARAHARTSHELGGALSAARLGVELGLRTGALSGARLRAVDLQLERAATALGQRARPSPVDSGRLVADAVAAWPGCEWGGEAAVVHGDRGRLAQALGNLIANAHEHGEGTVRVVTTRAGGCLRIEVTDEGAGLARPLAELLGRRPAAGRGHGLKVAAEVAAEHGGRLLSAPAERGARLVLELPVLGGAVDATRTLHA
jgi:signal transduction histidine kinase